ncbi:DMT family transporter [Hydrogenovibrio kuenenii]|uniref:DMT family transporter n=1 Tax=Hydrogenovibrio kuenenii TaxID=63658 RepID=UPI000467B95E|nr:DMT family transporter [Hydrogenovibrio kuenenii]
MNAPSVLKISSQQRKGEFFALGLTLIEAWFPIFASFTVSTLGPLHAYTYSLVVASSILLGLWLYRKRTAEILKREAYFSLLMVSLLISSVFALVFLGLNYTSANNVAIILFLQILFAYLFLGRKQGETLNLPHTLGVILMTLGAVLVLFPKNFSLHIGDGLVLLAAIIAPIANLYQKRARQHVSSETILLVRSLLALPVLYLLALYFEPTPSWHMIQTQWIWLLLTGGLVFVVSKIFWVEALHLLPITKVNALFALAPLLTIGLSYWILNQAPTLSQLAGALPILFGGYLITRRVN